MGAVAELEELGDAAAVLARNFLLMFMEVNRFVGAGEATVEPPFEVVSVVKDGVCPSAVLSVPSTDGFGLAACSGIVATVCQVFSWAVAA